MAEMEQTKRKLKLPPPAILNHITYEGHKDFEYHHEYELGLMGPTCTIYKCLVCKRIFRVEELRE